MQVGKKTIILNMLLVKSESSFSDVEESDGSDMESSSERILVRCGRFESYMNDLLAPVRRPGVRTRMMEEAMWTVKKKMSTQMPQLLKT